MRTDVKLGVVFALVMVLTAGGYFMFRGEKQAPISLSNAETPADPKAQPGKPAVPTKAAANQPRSAANPNRPVTNPRPTPNNTNPTASRTTPPAANPSVSKPAVTPVTSPDAMASQPASKPIIPNAVAPSASPAGAPPAVSTSTNPTIEPGSPQANPTASPATSTPSVVADRTAAPTTGKEVSLTGIPSTSLSPAINPNTAPAGMSPLTNRPTNGSPLDAGSASAAKPTTTIPPGIGSTTTPPKTDSALAPKVNVPEAATETHKVQTGDSLTSLAQTYYGDTKYAKILADANPKLADPNRLRVGTLINIPPLPANADAQLAASNGSKPAEKVDANGKRIYTVKAGDSFYSIAKSQLGNASRWKELLALNNSAVNGDPTSLQPGQRLVLPESR